MTKKGRERLRLVIDARRANRLFKKAPWCPLGSIESLCRVRVSQEQTLFTAQEDVRDFFYRLGIDETLSVMFGLPALKLSVLRKAFAASGVALPNCLEPGSCPEVVTPTMQVLPMGFSWAFWLSQQAHIEIAHRSMPDVVDQQYILDRVPPRNLLTRDDYAILLYADNVNH